MNRWFRASVLAGLTTLSASFALCEGSSLTVPPRIEAGATFSITTGASGKATLYLVGPAQALRRDLPAGGTITFAAGVLYAVGHYVAVLSTDAGTSSAEFDVLPAAHVETLGFLAKPSRLPVGLHNGISGAVYVFDAYQNLVTAPLSASLELANASGIVQARTLTTRNGLAWTGMDSAAREGTVRFIARVGGVTSTRIIQEVPGDPCGISISARPSGNRVQVETAPVRDCSGNAIPDGTIVTFTETFGSTQSTVDVPLKQGIARVELPSNRGSKISVASGIVAGNEIRWEGGR